MSTGEEVESIAHLLVESEPSDIDGSLDAENWSFPQDVDDRGKSKAGYDTGDRSVSGRQSSPDYPVTLDMFVKPRQVSITFTPAGDDMTDYRDVLETVGAESMEVDFRRARLYGLETSQLPDVMAAVEEIADRYTG